jgi:anti-anti-sigma regulatory factor
LIIDLSEVTHIDAAGIDILVNAAARAGEADIALRIAGLHGAVKDALLTPPAYWSCSKSSRP